ncbi:hypothetical protein H0B56_03850 [Haloechinothrix sp. YIM 98757]|uniref:Uncharacterized protein n=1 Tax=Haloechinothrix aidingensis TaxID=2752311 RepID=A0A838A8B7_9PSEU|nr:hypothetical protein [Haloechinothrix aidingensis]MBA0124669.1 hypothetical protein [Haloechinothrix aidingensis]
MVGDTRVYEQLGRLRWAVCALLTVLEPRAHTLTASEAIWVRHARETLERIERERHLPGVDAAGGES